MSYLKYHTILILICLLVWIVQAVRIVCSQKKLTWKSGVNFLASGCIVVGAFGFFGSALSAAGALNWLPSSFEWPVGEAKGALKRADGFLVVPHIPSGRIQIYNGDLEFQRGWYVQASGGKFKLAPINHETFYVYTTRGNKTLVYDIYGSLLPSEKYEKGTQSRLTKARVNVEIPTPLYLKVFVHPLASWIVAAVGMLLLFSTGAFRKTKPNKRMQTDRQTTTRFVDR